VFRARKGGGLFDDGVVVVLYEQERKRVVVEKGNEETQGNSWVLWRIIVEQCSPFQNTRRWHSKVFLIISKIKKTRALQ
jgi:hypothetical protein